MLLERKPDVRFKTNNFWKHTSRTCKMESYNTFASTLKCFLLLSFIHTYFFFHINCQAFRMSSIPSFKSDARHLNVLMYATSEEAFGNVLSSITTHHAAIRTGDIERAILFYSLLGFHVETKFLIGSSRAAWLTTSNISIGTEDEERAVQNGCGARLELIEVPKSTLIEKEGTRKRAPDLIKNEGLLGWNHVALDVSSTIRCIRGESEIGKMDNSDGNGCELFGLAQLIETINEQSLAKFGKTLRVAIPPQQLMISKRGLYEVAFLYDADGCLVELLNFLTKLKYQDTMDSGWDEWDGTGFEY